MGLIEINKENGQFLSFVCSENEINAEVYSNIGCYSLKVTLDNKSILKWSRNLQIDPEQYMSQLNDALISAQISDAEQLHYFEIEGDCLVWKQYFPNTKLTGRKGKFELSKVDNAGTIVNVLKDACYCLKRNHQTISTLQQNVNDLHDEIKATKDIAEKSITIKNKLEETLYGKLSVLLNAKKCVKPGLDSMDNEYDVNTDVDSGSDVEPPTKTKKKSSPDHLNTKNDVKMFEDDF